jgi:hypothetical protein
LFAKSRFVWVRPIPDTRKDWIGFLWTGGSVELANPKPQGGPGCATFYAIEPRGYVCVDGESATLDEHDPVYRALLRYAPKTDSPFLHSYGESLGLVRYRSTPTVERQRELEPTQADEVSLPATAGFEFPPLPRAVFENRRTLSELSTVAYSAEARFGNRGFLLAADYAWLPKARVKPYAPIEYHGVRLSEAVKLPLAFVRKAGRIRYQLRENGAFAAHGEFTLKSYWPLTGKVERVRGHRYFETRDGDWIREIDAVIPEPRSKTPWGAPLFAADTTGRAPKGRRTWIEVSLEGGWLLAFEGTTPVYATLISPGIGGVAVAGESALDTSATPTGTFPISGKLLTATMEGPGGIVHSDVPFVQNIVKPYALHGAYWHDNWGNPQSGGCVNLSPIDAKWLFEFTEPELPKGWHATRWLPSQPATIVILHR